ncbi:MAG: hypothetical protein S0880_31935, partial [Actinomycetota bacterium]|nr:hypothetical protein [Actinomycetota bacterium]
MPTTTHRPHHRLAALAAVGTVLALGVTACGTTGPSASDADVASVRFVAAVPTTATPTGPEEAPPAPSATPAPTTAAPAPTTVAPTAGT